MPLENSNFISELNPAWPLGTDGVNTSDDHHRNTKKALQQSFPAVAGEVTASHEDLNMLAGAASVGSGLNPIGTVIMFHGDVAPNGYLLCDGAAIDLQYVDLIALVGANTPALQGQFIRGTSVDAAVDPDGPRAAGSAQGGAVGPHTHTQDGSRENGNVGPVSGNSSRPTENQLQVNANTGPETRPVNVALSLCIKW